MSAVLEPDQLKSKTDRIRRRSASLVRQEFSNLSIHLDSLCFFSMMNTSRHALCVIQGSGRFAEGIFSTFMRSSSPFPPPFFASHRHCGAL